MNRPDYEYDFDPGARNNTAATIAELAASGGQRVLDLGSGPGIVAAYLQKERGRQVTCVDRDLELLARAEARGVSRTLAADLEQPTWIEQLAGEEYDVILLADVLEHLIDPGALLRLLADHQLLAPGGYLVVSFPNAGHEAVIGELLAGRFTYQDTGLLDSSHLRFFTLDSMRELLERNGFGVTRVARTKRTAEQTSLGAADAIIAPEIRERLVEDVSEIQTFQFILRAEPTTVSGQLTQLRRELRSMRSQLAAALPTEDESPLLGDLRAELEEARDAADRADRRAATSSAARDDTMAALARQRDLTQTERERATKLTRELERLRAAATKATDEASAEAALLQRELDKVYRSRTWRAGRLLWNVFHLPRRLVPKPKPKKDPAPVATAPAPQPIQAAPVDYVLSENLQVREKYEEAAAKHVFGGRDRSRNIAIAVYTTNLDEGRGDVYTAIGLGRHLEHLGLEVVYLPRDRWYEPPADTGLYLAMLETVDISQLPGDVTTIAWVRNSTDAWIQQPWLPLYDLVLASSQASLETIAQQYPGPTGCLPLAVDTELFTNLARPEDRTGVVSTVNQWGRERQLHTYLQEAMPQAPIALYGQQRGVSPELEPVCRGPVSFFALPSLYNQAAIVLDDFNHTTAPYGNVNSRVFEAVACGAIVMTNTSHGLDALDLDQLAVFGSARELKSLVERDLESTDAVKLADELGRHVLVKHSYAARARQFVELIERQPGPASQPVIAHFPDYRDNPYSKLMWAKLTRAGSVAIAIENSLDFELVVRIAKQRPTVMHLNWTAPILGPGRDEAARLERYHAFLSGLERLHTAGVPTIWTIHNVLPHECADPALEAQLRQEIADRVDAIHVMCEATVEACAPYYEIPLSKMQVIPHPSYIDVYPNLVDKALARDELRIDHDAFVYLHFGQVRPYKGVDLLLDAFERLASQHPKARLLLVGAAGRFEGIEAIKQRARGHSQVLSNFNQVADTDVQLYMNAADVVVLPHRSALNSGALQLAYSFARPVVAPSVGCIADLVDNTTGVTFSPDGTATALLNAMLDARRLGPEHQRAAYQRAAQSHYLQISDRFASLVVELSHQGPIETIR